MAGRKREVNRGRAQSNRVVAQGVPYATRDLRAMARVIIALTLWKHESRSSEEVPDE